MDNPLKILLIEDDRVDAMNFERVLHKTDFQVDFKHLSTPQEGFKELNSEDYDVVFLDYHLPGGNGLSMLKSLRESGVYVPVVIITSYADPNVAVEMIQSGASDYIPKSLLNSDGLSQCLRSCLKVNQLERKRRETESRLKKVEDRLGTIISNTPIILFVIDKEEAFRLGIGKHWDDFIPDSRGIIGLSYKEVFKNYSNLVGAIEASFFGTEKKCLVKREEVLYEITITPSLDRNNEVKEVLGLALDITDHVKGQDTLRNAKLIAENASKMKQEFIANMSHEIRTPMNAIIGFTNLLLESKLDPMQKEFINSIKVSGDNLLTLINDVLDFSKIESGKLTFDEEDFDLENVVSSVVKVLSSKAKEKHIELRYTIDQEVPSAINGDSRRLYQILLNLVGNSIKFTNDGGVYIAVKLQKKSINGARLNFEITDTGMGIPEDKIDSIFDSFIQVDGKSNRKTGGTGLGLTIVKNLLDLMDGEIVVTSTINQGTCFSFNLPFKVSREVIKLPAKKVNLKEKYKKLKGKRILLAEDNAMNQQLVIMYLKKFEVNIDLAENGIEALKAIKSNDYELIIMDIQMPEMDGIEATYNVRNTLPLEKRNIPILAMTAHAFKEEIEKCFEVGMNAHVSKPIEKNEFLNIIASLVLDGDDGNEAVSQFREVQNKEIEVDLSYLRNMADGNDAFIRQMIEIFKTDHKNMIEQMRLYYADSNWTALSKIAHKYRSPAVMMGMKAVGKIAELIEYRDFHGDNSIVSEYIDNIEKQSQEAIAYIETKF